LLGLEKKLKEIAESVRSNATKKRDNREEDGVGDQLMEMHESSWWPIDKIERGIQNRYVFFSLTKNTIEVMILWDDEDQIDDWQLNPTKQILAIKICTTHWFM
jgi:hypothetical protein